MTSIALPTAVSAPAAASVCAHCGEALRAGDRDGFCCPGCASAHAIIDAVGLGSFYARLDGTRAHRPQPLETDFALFASDCGNGTFALDLLVEGLDCAACVWLIESLLARDTSVTKARVNFSTRRLALRWHGAAADANRHAGLIAALGFTPTPFRASAALDAQNKQARELLRCLAVAGFGATNIMLLSVAIWSGAASMGEATRALFHWLSAAIALPVVAYAGRPFFESAWTALKARRTNMDVPISIGVTLACAVSLYQTWIHAEHAYFDSAATLLFFLLIGRYLDRQLRSRARLAVQSLLALLSGSARVALPDGTTESRRFESLVPGDILLVASGERLGADGRILTGHSSLDASLITGESRPIPAGPGDAVTAGTTNLGPTLRVEVTAAGEQTALAEIVRLVEAAEQGRSRFVAIADRVARAYAPIVHLTAFMTFVGWVLVGGMAWDRALVTATAVLIITCPCALALAVPVTQLIAGTRLMKSGLLLLSPTALERLASVDHVVFDKTGTLTLGRLELVGQPDAEALEIAAGLALSSRHPLSKALVRAFPGARAIEDVVEYPGEGLKARDIRLGSAAFCGVLAQSEDGLSELWLARPDRTPVRFAFADRLRPDARDTLTMLRELGITAELLSGDRLAAVARTADEAGIEAWRADVGPVAKVARLRQLADMGRKVLMVGDGLNDAPALAAAHVSLSPSSATEAAQNAADAVFRGDALRPVADAISVSRRARRIVGQNLVLALTYNLAAVPLAVCGLVTPLLAAIAMSSSSILVIVNALRLGARREGV
jgi:Cu2+-exporting ATPase